MDGGSGCRCILEVLKETLSVQRKGGGRKNFRPQITELLTLDNRSQWPRGLRHEPSSPTRTLGSWGWVPHKAWMSLLCAFILCLCCPVFRHRPCDGLITRQRSPTDCVKRSRNWKSGQGPTNGCRAIDRQTDRYLILGWRGLCNSSFNNADSRFYCRASNDWMAINHGWQLAKTLVDTACIVPDWFVLRRSYLENLIIYIYIFCNFFVRGETDCESTWHVGHCLACFTSPGW
jgi:hypothetical protein